MYSSYYSYLVVMVFKQLHKKQIIYPIIPLDDKITDKFIFIYLLVV